MKSKCHIIASENGASKEVCDNSVLFFNPFSPEELSKKILEIVSYYPRKPIINNTIILDQTWEKTSKYIFQMIEENSIINKI